MATQHPRAFPTVTSEPPAGSIVMSEGDTGTAHQRFYSDGLWHSTSGKTRTWAQLVALTERPGAFHLGLVYRAPDDEPLEGSTPSLFEADNVTPAAHALPGSYAGREVTHLER